MSDSRDGSSPDLLLVEKGDGIAVITLNRPQARNALSSALLGGLRRALADAGADDSIRVIILTGSDPAFCAGLDLKELSQRADSALLDDPAESDGIPVGRPWAPLGKPVIGAINGVAVTGGFELALNCDFLIASERAAFADTHTRVGILPGWGLSVLLPQLVGFGLARRMSFTGDYLPAADARRAGLVTEVVPHEELLPTARQVAASIAANNTTAVNTLLMSYRSIEASAQGDGLDLEARTSIDWRRTGGSQGLADRVGGVFERGRAQVAGGDAERRQG
jgi:enoyl-CoA hydratase